MELFLEILVWAFRAAGFLAVLCLVYLLIFCSDYFTDPLTPKQDSDEP